jgi:hypothetical protein
MQEAAEPQAEILEEPSIARALVRNLRRFIDKG